MPWKPGEAYGSEKTRNDERKRLTPCGDLSPVKEVRNRVQEIHP